MLNLCHVLQLVVDGLNQSPLAQKGSVRYCHDLALHIALKFGYRLKAVHEEFGEEVLADISLVSDQFAENLFDEGFVTQGLAVIDIARREHEIQEVALLVADEMQLEAIEPSHRALAALGKSVNLDESVIKSAEIIRDTENFSNFVIVDRYSERVCFDCFALSNLQRLSLFS